jgi:hypothetical protein
LSLQECVAIRALCGDQAMLGKIAHNVALGCDPQFLPGITKVRYLVIAEYGTPLGEKVKPVCSHGLRLLGRVITVRPVSSTSMLSHCALRLASA